MNGGALQPLVTRHPRKQGKKGLAPSPSPLPDSPGLGDDLDTNRELSDTGRNRVMSCVAG